MVNFSKNLLVTCSILLSLTCNAMAKSNSRKATSERSTALKTAIYSVIGTASVIAVFVATTGAVGFAQGVSGSNQKLRFGSFGIDLGYKPVVKAKYAWDLERQGIPGFMSAPARASFNFGVDLHDQIKVPLNL